jgi:hypothetical protein
VADLGTRGVRVLRCEPFRRNYVAKPFNALSGHAGEGETTRAPVIIGRGFGLFFNDVVHVVARGRVAVSALNVGSNCEFELLCDLQESCFDFQVFGLIAQLYAFFGKVAVGKLLTS